MTLNRRQKGARAREIVREITGMKPKGSNYGTGTAGGWLTIRMPLGSSIPCEQMDQIEAQIVAEGLCSTYLPDDGFTVGRAPCLEWDGV